VNRAWFALVVFGAACKQPHPASRPTIGLDASEGRITAEVLNGSNRPGLARLGTLALRDAGVDVISYGTADQAIDSTLILVRRGRIDRGRLIARALGVGVVRVVIDTLRRVDVSVILGRDYQPPGNRP
jgi:hypothetical protein